jgi:hypothetical protein
MAAADIASLDAMRQDAGRRYAAAVAELLEAYADLATVEGDLADPDGRRTFGAHLALPDALPALRHREFVPALPKDLAETIAARRAQLRGD